MALCPSCALAAVAEPATLARYRRKFICPQIVEYVRAFKARATEELALPPEGSAIAEMLADCTVMWEQVRVVSFFNTPTGRAILTFATQHSQSRGKI